MKAMPNSKEKPTVVLASGVFDLLHLGHVKFLEEAKAAGGKNAQLIVIIARDSTVEKTKGRKPIMPENQRRALVESLKVVDEAVLGVEGLGIDDVVKTVKPDIIALGYDQKEMERQVKQYVQKNQLSVKVVRVGKFEAEELDSSSKIRKKIVEKYT
jgi:FAD synthetase